MTATWCACLGNEGIVASKQENQAHILNQDLLFVDVFPSFPLIKCPKLILMFMAKVMRTSRCFQSLPQFTACSFFLCVFFFLARVSPIFQLVQFPTKNYTAENYDLESTKIHGFGFVDVLIPT